MKSVWSGDWPIPQVIQLPGCRVRVKRVPRAKALNADGAWVYNPPNRDGRQYATILIDEAQPIARQRYTLLHELQHTMVELLNVAIEEFPADVNFDKPNVVPADVRVHPENGHEEIF